MEYNLTDEQKDIVSRTRKIAIDNIKPVRQKYDREEIFPWDIVKLLGEAGLFGVYIPEEYGGRGMGVFELVLVVEEISKVDGGIALCLAATALGAYPILLGANDEQKKKFLSPLATGEKLAAFALTEHEAGSDATALRTTADKDGDDYVLNGTKCFITNGGEADIYTVIAVTDKKRGPRGISAFVVEKGTPGFEFGKKENKLGIRASATRELIFENCRIPNTNLLSRQGMGLILGLRTFDATRPGVAAQALGIAAGALDEAVAYATKRIQFGETLASLQAIQYMLADMATEVEAARALLYATARTVDSTTSRTTKESAMSKLYASDVAMRVTNKAIQVFGGRGYMHDYPVEKMMRDAKITQIYEGTNQIQRNEIALALIKESTASVGRA
ncbi:MAG: acyl-CoA dehydrogenase family protein [Candidatus Eisenbacteria bacterium]